MCSKRFEVYLSTLSSARMNVRKENISETISALLNSQKGYLDIIPKKHYFKRQVNYRKRVN